MAATGGWPGAARKPSRGRRDDDAVAVGDDPELRLAALPHNDLGNARRLLARYGDDILYVRELGWLGWDGRVWSRETGEHIAEQRAHMTADDIAAKEASALRGAGVDGDRVARHRQWAIASGNRGRLTAMLEVARPYAAVSIDEIDAEPRLLAVENGTLHLAESGEVTLRDHARDDRITRMAPVVYDEAARAPQWEAFLERILPDADVRNFLRMWFGYCMTGLTSEQLVVMLYGLGANGKSTMLNVLRRVLGEYVVSLPFASFTDEARRGGGDATPDLVRLPGARLALASEPRAGTRLSEAMIKAQTGGEPMIVRALHRDFFEFVPTHKLVLSFNNRPKVAAQDEGTWRRIAVVPFRVTIPREERVDGIDRRIVECEAAGVLNWLINGYQDYVECGLQVPEAVRAETAEYRTVMDPLADFIEACIVRVPRARMAAVPASEVYRAYQNWCAHNAVEPINRTRFGRIMTEHGFERFKRSGVNVYLDIELRDPGPVASDGSV